MWDDDFAKHFKAVNANINEQRAETRTLQAVVEKGFADTVGRIEALTSGLNEIVDGIAAQSEQLERIETAASVEPGENPLLEPIERMTEVMERMLQRLESFQSLPRDVARAVDSALEGRRF